MSSIGVVIDYNAVKAIENRFDNEAHLMAYDMARQVRSRVPVLTGNLKSSVETVRTRDGYDVIAGENGFVYGHAQYAYKQEMYNPRKPHFMRNTFDQTLSGSWQARYFGGLVK